MVIGLTGGIATGKSSVASILEKWGFEVIDADLLAHAALERGKPANAMIAKSFPSTVLSDETIDRKKLARIVFEDPAKRRILENILHPEVLAEIKERIDLARDRKRNLVAMVPLLFEKGLESWMDEVWVVKASRRRQMERLMHRDRLSEREAELRLEAQWPLEKKVLLADAVIDNEESPAELERKVAELLVSKGLLGANSK
ncbi:MAG TPA: dephospho-CoA kinase [Chroococcales cyanobacterium]